MSNISYAYAVANLRAVETNILKRTFFEQLISAPTVEEANRLLRDKGILSLGTDYMQSVWDYICEIAPEIDKFEFLIVKNDFHNLKAILKGIVAGEDGTKACVKPCIIDRDFLYDTLNSKNFDELPVWIRDVAKDAYALLTSSMDGRLFEMFVDRASLQTTIDFVRRADSEFCTNIVRNIVAITNIKTAYRLANNRVEDSSLEYAFAQCDVTDEEALKLAVKNGKAAVLDYLGSTKFASLKGSLETSLGEFERKSDEAIYSPLSDSRTIILGLEPIVAYYYSKETEYKNIRLIMGVKTAGLSLDLLNERLGEIYV